MKDLALVVKGRMKYVEVKCLVDIRCRVQAKLI